MSNNYGDWEVVANRPCNLPLCLLKGFNEATSNLVGATYVPLLYCAKQVVNGTNYFIIAKQTLSTCDCEENIVKVILNESLPTGCVCNFTVVSITKLT